MLFRSVMGMLETRSLDFDNIIITSMNEKVFPRRHARPSFIPEALRHAFGLPGKDAAEKDYGYYFYRLLTRARRVVLLYDARTEGVDRSGEMSRYLAQLVYLLPPGRVTHSTATFPPLSSSSAEPISIEKTPAVMQALDLFRREGSRKNLSASAINRYINCPLEFYLTAVCGLNFSSPSDGDDFIDSSTFGTIVHDVAENLYSSLAARSKDGIIKAETLRSSAVAAVVNPFVTSAVNRHYLRRVDPKDVEGGKKIPLKGLNRIQGRLIHDIVCRLMTAEADTFGDIPFVAAEYDFSGQVELAPGIRVNVRQVIDRIDRAGAGGSLRFVDYKTGSDDLRFPSIQAAFDPSREKRPKVLLQLLGRAARNVNGRVIMYANRITPSMRQTIEETERRRIKQIQYNEAHGIVPQQIRKATGINELAQLKKENDGKPAYSTDMPEIRQVAETQVEYDKGENKEQRMERLRKQMKEAAARFDFILAAQLRDELIALEKEN